MLLCCTLLYSGWRVRYGMSLLACLRTAATYVGTQVEAPRMWTQGAEVLLERTFPDAVFGDLKDMGNNQLTFIIIHYD
jgi:hypothetical protein